MNSKPILTGIACLVAGAALAQSPIQSEVDVTRAFEPSVQNALKLNVIPDMSDTTQMRMDFQYEITPRPLSYGFAVNPLTPARIAAVGDPERYPFYVKAGLGFPMQSVADVRYAAAVNASTRFGAFISHYGRYSKIENDMSVKEKATKSDNRAGAFIDFNADEDFTISGEIHYDYRTLRRYGYYRQNASAAVFDLSDEAMKQYFQDGGIRLSIGNSFTDLEKFNFKLDAGLDLFGDRYKYNQMAWDVGLGYDGFLKI
ncbi:MAG: hypothetical protein LUD68_01045 [Rikenellaceae bacterium]|nr:hypothetical protein [Rikenellaceae bacterium]